MNGYIEIKELLDKYYKGLSTDADEQCLREYFTSGDVAAELLPYRSIFAYLQSEREHPAAEATPIILPAVQPRRVRWWSSAKPLRRERRRNVAADVPVRQVRWRSAAVPVRRIRWWFAAVAVAACLSGVVFLVRKHQPVPPTAECTGTYVMVNGVCYDDISLIRKYAVETIDLVTQPFENSSPSDDPSLLNEE
jgi:hypothetical protein